MADTENIDVIADPIDKIACRKCGRHLDVKKLAFFSKIECPDCHTKQTVPAQLGTFLLLEVLGAGGMGAVYKALDKSLGRYVAIKVMRKALGEDPQFVESFLREARTAAALNHRNVVQIYSCGQEKGQPYIVMELVSGGRLDEIIAQGNPIEEVRALEIGIDIAEGLKAANEVGLIHGDIKPANILFDKEGVAKVVDFGLAQFVTWQQDRGEVWGTPYYIAPEKARGQKADHRSDIYSLGATLYHALGAKPPFDGKTATDVVLARLKNPAIGLRVLRPTLQPETADVISRMLEMDPFTRYPTYTSLLADMREALRVAKQEQRALHTKVKKSPVGPAIIALLIIIGSIAAIVGTLKMAQVKREQKAAAAAAATSTPVQVATVVTAQAPAQASGSKIVPVVQPFTPGAEQVMAAAVQLLVNGDPAGMRQQLQSLYDKTSPIGMGRYWLRLYQAVACWAGGRNQDGVVYLLEIRNAVFESPDSAQPHPGAMPQTLAKFMLKQIEEGQVSFEAARGWPAWYGDLAEFFVGFDWLREGNLTKAADFFASYVEKNGTNPSWPYALRPIAQKWRDEIVALAKLKENNAQWLAAKQTAKARTATEDFRLKADIVFFPMIDRELTAIKKAEQTEMDQVQRAERIAHQEKVQADLDKLDEVRAANIPLVGQKDFRKASSAVVKLIPEMKTPEGQQALTLLREAYDRLDTLKKFLMNRISVAPFRGGVGSELGGDAVGADLNGIRVALGQHGEMVVPWEEVSVRLMLQLANYYLADTALPEKERAEQQLNAALYCFENAGIKTAATYAEQACKLNPELKPLVRKFMPDLLPD